MSLRILIQNITKNLNRLRLGVVTLIVDRMGDHGFLTYRRYLLSHS